MRMQTIQIVLDADLLRAADATAKKTRVNRSALFRRALREHLNRLRTKEREESERRSYEERPDDPSEIAEWESEQTWPE